MAKASSMRPTDPARYGQQQTEFLRAFLEASFTAQLTAADTDPVALASIWSRTAAIIADDPAGAAPSWRRIVGQITRTS
ncbi:MAG: hypothetical protein HRT86_04975 [Ilumatobacteraceae bacterium]|nr:hypothetical protein [Ilumatobacteraceae bacterium]